MSRVVRNAYLSKPTIAAGFPACPHSHAARGVTLDTRERG
jgi:hypothetical protein